MHTFFLILGSNIGDAKANVQHACNEIKKQVGKITAASSYYVTAPWGGIDQNDFYNLVIKVESGDSPSTVLNTVLKIEKDAGRERLEKYGPRLIDIDILFCDNQIINLPGLTIPHPLVQKRNFALTPLSEIAPQLKHPVFHKTIRELLKECTDEQMVIKKEDTVNF